jgi:DNA polymerase-3 subunit delta'
MKYVGHKREREIFSKAISADKLVHSYIFSGKDSCGKKLLAVEIAKALFCGAPLLEHANCRHASQIDSGSHPDLHIYGEESILIEHIREMGETAYMSPLSADYKIYILDNAHNMRAEAANAFLKTLEEPGENTVIFLITDKYERLLPTIRSRCVHVEFSNLTDSELTGIINELRPDAKGIEQAAKLAAGSVSQALYFLDNGIGSKSAMFSGISAENMFKRIESLKEKDDIRIFCSLLYAHLLEEYKKDRSQELLAFSNYLLDILQRLNYNVNPDIFRLDLFSKITEVLIERN